MKARKPVREKLDSSSKMNGCSVLVDTYVYTYQTLNLESRTAFKKVTARPFHCGIFSMATVNDHHNSSFSASAT